MIGIFGSGFGLYAHLPALAQLRKEAIFVPERYKSVFDKRKELHCFSDRIVWMKNETQVLERSDTVVFSVWPQGQEILIPQALSIASIRRIILEKPIGVSPESSGQLLSELEKSGKIFRVNYSFLYLKWYNELQDLINDTNVKCVQLTWKFTAHHYKNNIRNWKCSSRHGGGAIRFYGIHLIAVLAALGFTNVQYSSTIGESEDDARKWEGVFINNDEMVFKVELDSKSHKDEFEIAFKYDTQSNDDYNLMNNSKNPFSEIKVLSSGLDTRVSLLLEFYKSLDKESDHTLSLQIYKNTNALWSATEKINNHFIDSSKYSTDVI